MRATALAAHCASRRSPPSARATSRSSASVSLAIRVCRMPCTLSPRSASSLRSCWTCKGVGKGGRGGAAGEARARLQAELATPCPLLLLLLSLSAPAHTHTCMSFMPANSSCAACSCALLVADGDTPSAAAASAAAASACACCAASCSKLASQARSRSISSSFRPLELSLRAMSSARSSATVIVDQSTGGSGHMTCVGVVWVRHVRARGCSGGAGGGAGLRAGQRVRGPSRPQGVRTGSVAAHGPNRGSAAQPHVPGQG